MDQFALTAADGRHGVDGLHPSLHGRVHVLALRDARRDFLEYVRARGVDRTLAIHRLADCVDNTPEELRTNRNLGDAAGGSRFVAFLDLQVVAQDDRADGVFFQVQGHPGYVVGKASSSPAMAWERPDSRATPSPTSRT